MIYELENIYDLLEWCIIFSLVVAYLIIEIIEFNDILPKLKYCIKNYKKTIL